MNKPLIPFGCLPGHWGLRGMTRDIAKAEYELEGYDLDIELAKIRFANRPDALMKEVLQIKLQYGAITKEQYEYEILKLEVKEPEEFKAKELALDFKYKKIVEKEYDLALANLKPEGAQRDRAVLDVLLKHRHLKQYDYDVAIAQLDREGVELALELNAIELTHKKISEYDYDVNDAKLRYDEDDLPLELSAIDLKHNKITEYDYDVVKANKEFEGTILELKLAKLQHDHRKINDSEYEKAKATIQGTPWVSVVSFEIDPNLKSNVGRVQLDWNEQFIRELVADGYTGRTDEEIINEWFSMVCTTVAIENGIIDASDEIPTISDEINLPKGRKEYR